MGGLFRIRFGVEDFRSSICRASSPSRVRQKTTSLQHQQARPKDSCIHFHWDCGRNICPSWRSNWKNSQRTSLTFQLARLHACLSMPRLAPSLLLRAKGTSPLLPLLLKTCRDLPSAVNELRWLKEHVQDSYPLNEPNAASLREQRLLSLCRKRSKGAPLQYLLGSQPFGDLDILCRPGVLIPRPETESYTTHLAQILGSSPSSPGWQIRANSSDALRVLDLCTGTGCVLLLLHSLLQNRISNLELHGVDISSRALLLARRNLAHNLKQSNLVPKAKSQISFQPGDVLSDSWIQQHSSTYDVVISNPPYISAQGYWRETSKSVRNYEPKLALVPQPPDHDPSVLPEDIFYPKLLKLAKLVNARVFLAEVADMQQASRVARFAVESRKWKSLEIWRDWPYQDAEGQQNEVTILGQTVAVKGSGHGRSVLCWT